MLLNELAQWASLIFLGILVLGLTRQLGDFLTPARDRVSSNRGPAVGSKLPDGLLQAIGRTDLQHLMRRRETPWALLATVSAECPRCAALLDELERKGVPEHAPVVLLAPVATDEFRDRLARIADLTVVDEDRLRDAGLTVKPFMVIVDNRLKVQHKEFSTDPAAVVRNFMRETGRVERSGDGSGDPLTIVEVGR